MTKVFVCTLLFLVLLVANAVFLHVKKNNRIHRVSQYYDNSIEHANPPITRQANRTRSRNILVLTTSDDAYADNFRWHTDSMRCYAEQQGYTFRRIVSDKIGRHLVVRDQLPQFDWILFLDGDAMVVNFQRRIEEYVDDDVNIVFIQRLINGEVASGAYLVKNTPWSHRFLSEVVTYGNRVHNADNGALLAALAHRLLQQPHNSTTAQARRCIQRFMVKHQAAYITAKCCLWALAGRRRKWPSLGFKIMRRGHGFMRDDWMAQYMMDSDFIIHHKHRWKHTTVNPFVDEQTGRCKKIAGLVWPQFRIDGARRRKMVCEKDVRFSNEGASNYAPDVAFCHPHCAADVVEQPHFIPTVDFCLSPNPAKPKFNASKLCAFDQSSNTHSP